MNKWAILHLVPKTQLPQISAFSNLLVILMIPCNFPPLNSLSALVLRYIEHHRHYGDYFPCSVTVAVYSYGDECNILSNNHVSTNFPHSKTTSYTLQISNTLILSSNLKICRFLSLSSISAQKVTKCDTYFCNLICYCAHLTQLQVLEHYPS